MSADALYTAVNRLLADGHTLARVSETGDVWIDRTEVGRTTLGALADELELPTIEIAQSPKATRTMSAQRIGLFKPWVASMDEGWTPRPTTLSISSNFRSRMSWPTPSTRTSSAPDQP